MFMTYSSVTFDGGLEIGGKFDDISARSIGVDGGSEFQAINVCVCK